MNLPEESANRRVASLFEKPSRKSLTLPLQELATLFSCPLSSSSAGPEPMEQAVGPSASIQPAHIHVEVCQAALSTLRGSQVRELVKQYYSASGPGVLRAGEEIEFKHPVLDEHVASITVSDVPSDEVSS